MSYNKWKLHTQDDGSLLIENLETFFYIGNDFRKSVMDNQDTTKEVKRLIIVAEVTSFLRFKKLTIKILKKIHKKYEKALNHRIEYAYKMNFAFDTYAEVWKHLHSKGSNRGGHYTITQYQSEDDLYKNRNKFNLSS